MFGVQDSKENREKCICPSCPSYPHKIDGEILYCSLGKSAFDINAKFCICNACPVYFEKKLNKNYYCNSEEVGESEIFMRKRKSDEDSSFYQTLVDIKDMAATGKSVVRSMGSSKRLTCSLDDIHFIPAQVDNIPLNFEDDVNTQVSLGPNARKPFKFSSPIMISGMSFGAVSKNVKMVIAETSSKLKIAFNSGEGGILQEELDKASNYLIVQYSTGRFGVSDKILKKAAAVEIRFGQGAYPGKGSYLPANKITSEIANVRGLKVDQPSYSPAHHSDMRNQMEIREKVSWLREITGGVPIGAKIGCGNVEKDIKILVNAKVDFIALDGFGGGTGATDVYVRENVGIPIFAALPRAFRFLQDMGVKNEISLIAGGGLRTSADFAKCIALGADAVYIGTSALIAINCEQYRICHTGSCPTGVTTHNPSLIKQLNVEEGIRKLTNFIKISTQEVANITRIVGKDDVNKLDFDDLVAMNRDLSVITGIKWLDGSLDKMGN
ncbi:MAG: DUF2769 domain-containing protein [Euryarchaeota archaeon]|nr:DUF2769 domain-containing protein [Euryarchaeota archaeon]